MLIPMLIDHPQMLGTVLRHTPPWVGLLLAGLIALGVSQMRARQASLARVSILPIAMTGLSLWGMYSAFGTSMMFGYAMIGWMLVASVAFAAIGLTDVPKGTLYESRSGSFHLPGSAVPLIMILVIFLTRYVVNVDVAMNPALREVGEYTLAVAAIYGLFTGAFLGRAARLWLLAARGADFALPAPGAMR